MKEEVKMKAVYLLEPGRFEIRAEEMPVPGDDEVVIKTSFCGICTLEQRLYRGDMKIYYPIVPGHEVSGEVAAVGKNADPSIVPGAKAAVDMIYRCHECYYCRRGESNHCLNRFASYMKPLGGMAEYLKVRAEQVYILPEEIPAEYAAFAEPAACCLRSLKKTGLTIAEDLHVAGAGPMGMLHLLIARAMGVRVIVSDIDSGRLEAALKAGADHVVNAAEADVAAEIKRITSGRGADAAILTSPAAEALKAVFGTVRNNGRVNIFTAYMQDKPPLPLDAETVHRRGIVVTGTEGRTEEDFLQAVRLLAYKKIDVSMLVSRIFVPEEAAAAMDAAAGRDTQRVLLKFN